MPIIESLMHAGDMSPKCTLICERQVTLDVFFSCAGYLFNIQFLRRIFDPTFTLHDLQQSGPNDITTRWTMRMEFALSKGTPLRKWWNPTLLFTGVSIMTVNPETGASPTHWLHYSGIGIENLPQWVLTEIFGSVVQANS